MDKFISIPKFLLLFAISFFVSRTLFSQSDTTSSNFGTADTIVSMRPILYLGSAPNFIVSGIQERTNFFKGDFVSAHEIIEKNSLIRFFSFGALGNSPLLFDYGAIGNISIYENLNSQYILPTYKSSFELFPLLLYNSIEIITGSTAEILCKHSNGLLLNFVTRKFNTRGPYTQIWIGQAGYEYLGSSGVFAQNFAPNINFFFLYQRYWSAGRYNNSKSERWSIVAGLRWFRSQFVNFYIQNKFTLLDNGLYGGLNKEKSTVLFDNNFSIVNFENLAQKSKQNDFSINYFLLLKSDSSFFLDGGALFSISKNYFDFDPYFSEFHNIEKNSNYYSSAFIFSSKITFKTHNYEAYLGAELEKRNQDKWLLNNENKNFEPSAYMIWKLRFSNNFKFQLGGRLSSTLGELTYSLGSKMELLFDTSTKTYVDVSVSKKDKSELFRNSFLGILGFTAQQRNFNISGEAFARHFVDYDTYILQYDTLANIVGCAKNGTQNLDFIGANMKFSIPIWNSLSFLSKINWYYFFSNGSRKEWLPMVIMNTGFTYRFSRGASYLDLGLEFELYSPFSGLYFHPLYQIPVEYNSRRNWQNNGLNIFASAKLGNAFVNVSFRNILSVNYYLLPIFPEYDRNVRITIVWSFND
ncbi:MAG: hypothetical protein N2560_09900 [Ignavibacteria bacterium]|nr:hypothetical protein [Ignavibacteria bacterium]